MPKLLHDIKFNLATSCIELSFLNEFIELNFCTFFFIESGQSCDLLDLDLYINELEENKIKHIYVNGTADDKHKTFDVYICDNYVNIDMTNGFRFSLEKQVFIEFLQDLCTIRKSLLEEQITIYINSNCIKKDNVGDVVDDEQTIIFKLFKMGEELNENEQKEIIDRILSETKHVIFEPK